MSEDSRKIELRAKTVEDAVRLLTELALNSDKRMDSFDMSLVELVGKLEILTDAQIRTEDRVAGLMDAQLRTEDRVGTLNEALARLAEAQARLAEAQAHTDGRLDALIDIIRRERNGE